MNINFNNLVIGDDGKLYEILQMTPRLEFRKLTFWEKIKLLFS